MYRDDFDAAKNTAEATIDWLFDPMSAELGKGGTVEYRNFGALKTKKSPAKDGHNPRTGEKIKIAAKTVVRFKAGKALLSRINP
jgi:nucleoid DNA-binding protein